MGQDEILEYLKEQRKKSSKWFTIHEIRIALEEKGMSNGSLKGIHNDLYKLTVYSLIDAKGVGLFDHKKVFRALKEV